MFDYLRLRGKINDRDAYIQKCPVLFTGTYVEATGEPIHKSFNRDFRGLKTNVYADSIRIDGSIQTFHNTDNFSEFNRSDLKRACQDLAYTYFLKETDLRITNAEASVTIEAPSIYSYMQSYKGRYSFTDMAKNNARYGKQFVMGNEESGTKGEYGGKCYDKTKQVKLQTGEVLHKQLQHFELCINNPRWFNQRHPQHQIKTLDTLYDYNVMTAVSEELIDLFYNITFSGAGLDYSALQEFSPAQVSQIVAMADPAYAAHLKAHHPETFKKHSRLYNKVKGNPTYYRNTEEVAYFGEKLVEQLAYQLNN